MSTSALPDGLAALQKKPSAKQPARRTIEPPRNPSRQAPYVPPAPLEPVAAAPTPEPAPAASEAPQPVKRTPEPKASKVPASEAQNRLTVYVDDSHDTFMDEAKFAGVRLRPKVDISRSAVVRFALERLQAEMTPDQVANAIAAKPTDDKALGRKRR